jgi:hypothetical protein
MSSGDHGVSSERRFRRRLWRWLLVWVVIFVVATVVAFAGPGQTAWLTNPNSLSQSEFEVKTISAVVTASSGITIAITALQIAISKFDEIMRRNRARP